MTRNEFARWDELYRRLKAVGFGFAEADQLYRIERTLHRWAEAECNGEIERDGDDGEGRPWRSLPAAGVHLAHRIRDRERGALRRLVKILKTHPDWTYYHQGDPRGCTLYLVRLSDVPAGGHLDGYHTRGIAVCI